MSESERPFVVAATEEEDPNKFLDLDTVFFDGEYFSSPELLGGVLDFSPSPDTAAIAGGAAGDLSFSWGRLPDFSLCGSGSGRALMGKGPASLTVLPAVLISSPPVIHIPLGMPHLDYPSCSSAVAIGGDQTTTNNQQLFIMDTPSQDNNVMPAISRTRKPKRSNLPLPALLDDDYKWRKYGDKAIKGCKGSRSNEKRKLINMESKYSRGYYQCTHPNCPARKHVHRSTDGRVAEIIYKDQHNHEPHQPGRSAIGTKNRTQATSIQIHEPIDSEFSADACMGFEEAEEEESCAEGSRTGSATSEGAEFSERATGPKVVVHTRSEVLVLDDGYRWRKYGQKVVKGNHNPR